MQERQCVRGRKTNAGEANGGVSGGELGLCLRANRSEFISDGRRGHDDRPCRGHDRVHVRDRRDPYSGRGRGRDLYPTGDHALRGRDLRPNNRHRSVRRHGAVRPNVRPRTVGGTNSLHASDNGHWRDTSNRQSRRSPNRAALEPLPPPVARVVQKS